MIKEIVVYPNDILTTPTKKTDLKTAQKLAVEMFKTLKQEGGLGLSANQIGEDKSVCVQHEIDHLNGLTIYDREYKLEQYIRTEKKYGRNEKVTISKGKKTLTLKYKKSIPYLDKGWEIDG